MYVKYTYAGAGIIPIEIASPREHVDVTRDLHSDPMLYTVHVRKRVNVSRFLVLQPEITCNVSFCHFCGCEILTLLTLNSCAITTILCNARTIGYNIHIRPSLTRK